MALPEDIQGRQAWCEIGRDIVERWQEDHSHPQSRTTANRRSGACARGPSKPRVRSSGQLRQGKSELLDFHPLALKQYEEAKAEHHQSQRRSQPLTDHSQANPSTARTRLPPPRTKTRRPPAVPCCKDVPGQQIEEGLGPPFSEVAKWEGAATTEAQSWIHPFSRHGTHYPGHGEDGQQLAPPQGPVREEPFEANIDKEPQRRTTRTPPW